MTNLDELHGILDSIEELIVEAREALDEVQFEDFEKTLEKIADIATSGVDAEDV